MKKYLITACLAVSFIFAFQSVSFAQSKGQIKGGIGLFYGDEPGTVGIQINGTYRINQHVEFSPDLIIYFPGNSSVYRGYWALDFNGHYIFANSQTYDVYALGGLNISTGIFQVAGHETKLGINLGIGSEYHLKNLSVFGELKYVVSDLDQVVIGAGVRVPIPNGLFK